MLNIVVTKPEIRELKGTGKTSGKPYHLRIQTAHAYMLDADGVQSEFPEKFEIMLREADQPYPRGKYTLHPASLAVKDGRLTVGDVRLVPAAPAAK
jgi:hypothetical protein